MKSPKDIGQMISQSRMFGNGKIHECGKSSLSCDVIQDRNLITVDGGKKCPCGRYAHEIKRENVKEQQ